MSLQISVHRSCWRPSDGRVTGWELFICAESSSWHRDSGTCPGFSCLPRQFFLAAVFSAGLSLSGDSVHHLSEWRHSCVSVCRGWRVCSGDVCHGFWVGLRWQSSSGGGRSLDGMMSLVLSVSLCSVWTVWCRNTFLFDSHSCDFIWTNSISRMNVS